MKKEIKEYLENLKEKFKTNNNLYQAYKLKGKKFFDVGVGTSQKQLNDLINEKLDEFVEEEIDHIVKIFYNISIKDYETGPLNIMCVVSSIVNGKISKKNTLSAVVFFTVEELHTYKLKKNDYKLIVKGLLNKSIESDPLKKCTRKDLDEI